jgi:hypothetical protein
VYLSLVPEYSLVTCTLVRSARGVSSFVVIFGIITYAFGIAFMLAFGNQLASYRDMTNSLQV